MRFFGQRVCTGKRGGLYVQNKKTKRYLRGHERDLIIIPKRLQYKTPFPEEVLDIIMDYKAQLDAPKETTFFLMLSRLEREFIVHSFFEERNLDSVCCHKLFKYAQDSIFVSKRIEAKLKRSALHY